MHRQIESASKMIRKLSKGVNVVTGFIYVVAVFLCIKTIFPARLSSAELTGIKDTLSSSRLSFVGAVATGNSSPSSILILKTSSLPGFATSDDNSNLFEGDNLKIGTTNNYTVIGLTGTTAVGIYSPTGGLGANDDDVDDPVIASRSAQHTVTFTPVSTIDSGYFRVRIKATGGSQAQSHDGIPDADGFDFRASIGSGTWPGYIDCNVGTGDTASIAYSGATNCTSGYTCIFCNYTGTNTLTQKTITVGTTATEQQAINPSPSSTSKTAGAADTYAFYVDHLDSSFQVVDSTQGRIAVVESVRVSATVDPTITFTIAAVSTGTTACGVAADVTTTATSVPFGSVSLASFMDAAQQLSCVTNAAGGYAVTALENDQMNILSGSGPDTATYIADSDCDGGADTCVVGAGNTAADWVTDSSNSGFGYSIENTDASKVAFAYDATSCSGGGYTGDVSCGNCAGAYCAMPFPANIENETALTLFKNTAVPSSTEDIYVCYRLVVSSTQTAGSYANTITYVASATF